MSSIGVGPEEDTANRRISEMNKFNEEHVNTYWHSLFANVWSATMDLAKIQTIILFRLPMAQTLVSMDHPYFFSFFRQKFVCQQIRFYSTNYYSIF